MVLSNNSIIFKKIFLRLVKSFYIFLINICSQNCQTQSLVREVNTIVKTCMKIRKVTNVFDYISKLLDLSYFICNNTFI